MKQRALFVGLLICTGYFGLASLAYGQDSPQANSNAAQSGAPPADPKASAGPVQPSENKARIVVYREKSKKGRWIKPPVLCDNTQVAYLDNGRYVILLVAPGQHTITSDKTKYSVVVDAKEDEVSFIKLHIVMGFTHGLGAVEQSPAETAKSTAASLIPIEPDAVIEPTMVCLDRTQGIKLCSLQE